MWGLGIIVGVMFIWLFMTMYKYLTDLQKKRDEEERMINEEYWKRQEEASALRRETINRDLRTVNQPVKKEQEKPQWRRPKENNEVADFLSGYTVIDGCLGDTFTPTDTPSPPSGFEGGFGGGDFSGSGSGGSWGDNSSSSDSSSSDSGGCDLSSSGD